MTDTEKRIIPDEQKLANPKKTIEIIQKYEFAFQKRFGQNFLIDSHVPEKMVAAAGIGPEDAVLEIGPGIGTLTQYLAEAAGQVICVEIDRMLIPILEETLKDYSNVTVLHQDIMKSDIVAIAREYNGGRPLKVAANLPYYITTPVVMALLEGDAPISSVTVMVQKEVALRMQAGPGTKDYGALSLAVQYYSDARIVANVPPNCFMPRPKVGSAVVLMDCAGGRRAQVKDERLLFALIRASFNQRRKTLVNGLVHAGSFSFGKEQILAALEALGLPAGVRGEALTLEEFAALANLLAEGR